MKESKRALLEVLIGLRREGKMVAGYGAPGKGNTLLNYCGIRTDLLDYTVDRNPHKHGLFTPGTHIPIAPVEHMNETRPDYLLVLPWNLIDEISAQLAFVADWGCKLIVPVPHAVVIEPGERSERAARGGESSVKVVIFCGGLGVRMGEATQRIPKPMIQVGTQPILWHIMKWYASWGHTDFVLCLGYRAEVVKEFFLNYREALANDFVLTNGGRDVELLGSDISDWRVTLVDTGVQSSIGERLRLAAPHLEGEKHFLATYGDGLTDAPLDDMVTTLETSGKTGLFIRSRPRLEYHLVDAWMTAS